MLWCAYILLHVTLELDFFGRCVDTARVQEEEEQKEQKEQEEEDEGPNFPAVSSADVRPP